MKTWVTLLVCTGLASVVTGQTASLPASTPTAMAAAPGKSAPGKAAPKADAKKDEPGKIEGLEVSRGDKGFLGVQVVDGRFKLNFYDMKKKPAKPDVVRAVLRWDPKYKVGMERVVLNPGAENSLTAERFIRPPYNFKLFITLLKDAAGGEDPVGESYTIDFRQ